jgi:hypothetical protein
VGVLEIEGVGGEFGDDGEELRGEGELMFNMFRGGKRNNAALQSKSIIKFKFYNAAQFLSEMLEGLVHR